MTVNANSTRITLALVFLFVPSVGASRLALLQSSGYGPEVKSFLEYVKHEEVELEFQIKHNEISRKDYERSKNRLEVHREAVLSRVKRTGEDFVPEYNVLAAPEVGDILPNGVDDLKGHRPGDVIDGKWKYVGTALKVERFYIFERTGQD